MVALSPTFTQTIPTDMITYSLFSGDVYRSRTLQINLPAPLDVNFTILPFF